MFSFYARAFVKATLIGALMFVLLFSPLLGDATATQAGKSNDYTQSMQSRAQPTAILETIGAVAGAIVKTRTIPGFAEGLVNGAVGSIYTDCNTIVNNALAEGIRLAAERSTGFTADEIRKLLGPFGHLWRWNPNLARGIAILTGRNPDEYLKESISRLPGISQVVLWLGNKCEELGGNELIDWFRQIDQKGLIQSLLESLLEQEFLDAAVNFFRDLIDRIIKKGESENIISTTLYSGWNMVSVVGGWFRIDEIFASSNCVLSGGPWWWNGENYERHSELDSSKGYWIRVDFPCTLNLPKGQAISQSPKSFRTGWHMISPVTQDLAADALRSDCTISGPYWYDPIQNQYIKPSILEPTKGYWVYVKESCFTILQFKPEQAPPPPPPGDDDDDGDGVPNNQDKCPNTLPGTAVDTNGCPKNTPPPSSDDDGDGVPNDRDRCPNTLPGTTVDADGCPKSPPPPGPGPGNQLPVASFTYSPQNPKPGEVITFDCSPSRDPDGTVVSCKWDFGGQGTHVSEQAKQHQHKFDREGTYTVTLTVRDNAGAESSTSQTINVRSSTTPGPGPTPPPPSTGMLECLAGSDQFIEDLEMLSIIDA